jgi:broad specificity phosphatase PhoE
VSHGGALVNIIAWWLQLPVESLNHCRFHGIPGGITHLTLDTFGFRLLQTLSEDKHLVKKKLSS